MASHASPERGTDAYLIINRWTAAVGIFGFLCLFYAMNDSSNQFSPSNVEIAVVKKTTRSVMKKIYSMAQYTIDRADGWFLCPSGREYRWDEQMVAFRSAYYHPEGDHVVLVCLSNKHRIKHWPFKHYCHFYDSNKELIAVVPGRFQRWYHFICDNNISGVSKLAKFVYISRNDTEVFLNGDAHWLASVQDLQQRKDLNHTDTQDRGELAICIGPLMPEQNWLLFLTFFEYYRTQGVSKFFVPRRYRFSDFTSRLMHYYGQSGLVEIDSWEASFPNCDLKSAWHCINEPQKSQCVLQAAYRYKYLLLPDFDELIANPEKDQLRVVDYIRWKDLREKERLEKMNQVPASFTFGSRFHLTYNDTFYTAPTDATQISETYITEHLPMIKWNNVNGNYVPTRAFSPKTVVKPELIKVMGVHVPQEFYNMTCNTGIDIPLDKAYIHHYKNASVWAYVAMVAEKSKFVEEDPKSFYNSSFVNKLVRNMVFTLKQIYNVV